MDSGEVPSILEELVLKVGDLDISPDNPQDNHLDNHSVRDEDESQNKLYLTIFFPTCFEASTEMEAYTSTLGLLTSSLSH